MKLDNDQLGRVEDGRYIRPTRDINGNPVSGGNTVHIGSDTYVEIPNGYRDFERLAELKQAYAPKPATPTRKKKAQADDTDDA